MTEYDGLSSMRVSYDFLSATSKITRIGEKMKEKKDKIKLKIKKIKNIDKLYQEIRIKKETSE
jgi:hypothetical protein